MALSAFRHVPGFAGAIRDGKLIVDSPGKVIAAGGQAMVPIGVGANDRDLGTTPAGSKEEVWLFRGGCCVGAQTL